MELKESLGYFINGSRSKALESALSDKKTRRGLLCGLAGSAPAVLLSAISKGTSLIVCDDMTSAGYMHSDLSAISGGESVCIFPSGYKRDIKYGQPDPPQRILRAETLERLGSSTKPR